MNNSTRLINQLLVLISIVLITLKLIELINAWNKKSTIIYAMENRKELLANAVHSCEVIGEIRDRKTEYIESQIDTNNLPKDKYWILRANIIKLNNKLIELRSGSCGFNNTYELFKDQLSNNIYIGMYDEPPMICESHTLNINGKEITYKPTRNYKLCKKENNRIEFRKYNLNNIGTIDTIIKMRLIEENTLYNTR